jgi:hypothetical protein
MAKKVTLVLPDNVFKHLEEMAASLELTLSSTSSSGIESLYWMYKQKEDGFTVKAEKEEKNRTIIRELSLP